MIVSRTPQDLSIASTLLRSIVSVICAPFLIEAICSFASFIASNVSFFDISFLVCYVTCKSTIFLWINNVNLRKPVVSINGINFQRMPFDRA